MMYGSALELGGATRTEAAGSCRREGVSMDVARYKDSLLSKRADIVLAGAAVRPVQATERTSSRQGDLADQATGNNEVHIQLKLNNRS